MSVPIPNPCTNRGARCVACPVGICCTELNTQGSGLTGQYASVLDERRKGMGRRHFARDTRPRSVALVGTVGFDVCCATGAVGPVRAGASRRRRGRGAATFRARRRAGATAHRHCADFATRRSWPERDWPAFPPGIALPYEFTDR